MEKREVMADAKDNNSVFRANICTGIVSLIKVVDDFDNIPQGAKCLKSLGEKKVVSLNIRKIVFEYSKSRHMGRDLFHTNRQGGYEYKVMIPSERNDYQNNTIVINNVSSMDDLLGYAGVPKRIEGFGLNKVRKIVFAKDEVLNIGAHAEKLTDQGISILNKAEPINKQAAELCAYRKLSLPDKPQQIEKVYAKYFK